MPFFYYFDPTYILILPAIIISIIAQVKCSSAFNKYSQIRNSRGFTGAQAAERVLSMCGVTGVSIVPVSGRLTDHFDPRSNTIRLSEEVYNKTTIAAVGVACHEAGHAVQHAQGYLPNKIRGVLVPASRIGSMLAFPLILIGFLFSGSTGDLFVNMGIIFYTLAVFFTVVTLPVEFNASSRALKIIKQGYLLDDSEYNGAKAVLQAAAMTYVAATITSLLQLLRLILLSNRRR